MPISPSKLLSSITEDYINYIATKKPYAYHDEDTKINAANYIRILKLAPTFLNFIKDSIYISTNKYSDDCIYTSVTTNPFQPTSDNCTYKILNDKDEIVDVIVDQEIIAKTMEILNILNPSPESWGNVSKSKIECNTVGNFFKTINSEQLEALKSIVNSGEFGARSDGATTSPTSHQLTISSSTTLFQKKNGKQHSA